jgi:hypothetical protein
LASFVEAMAIVVAAKDQQTPCSVEENRSHEFLLELLRSQISMCAMST